MSAESIRPHANTIGPARPAIPGERLIVALDFPGTREAMALVDTLGMSVSWYKVGMELFYAEGKALLTALEERGKRVFLDLKLHDIPNTMASALRSLSRLPVHLTTLHIPAGSEALRACVEEAARLAQDGRPAPGLLGVTRLTSLPPPDPENPWDDVVELAASATQAGLFGLIAPAPAAPFIRRALGARPALVCPGIRLPDQARQDQVAVGSPEDAVNGGADWIVVGRPVTRADDPTAAVREICTRLGG